MLISEVRKLPPLERFLYWVRERNQILLKRQAGYPKPWTDDEILQSHYFTNVERENDKVTLWFKNNVRERLRNDPIVVFATIAFRWFNLPQPTGEYLNSHGYLEDWNTEKVVAGLTEFKNRGLKVFTGAFNISNSGSSDPKINRVCEAYIEPVWQQRATLYQKVCLTGTLQSAFEKLNKLPGLGGSGFMAAQVVCDLAYTHVLADAKDWWNWSCSGPGSKKGIALLGLGKSWIKDVEYLRSLIQSRLGLKLHARDVQNCLCEYFKYDRALFGGGSKRRYPGK